MVWLVFDPQTGHEQKGRRPAVCVFQKEYNQKIGLALFCPVTSHIKG
nr:type II toxin-antitoxin system PemK/MazF family toxin [uncultured Treponema sp.]